MIVLSVRGLTATDHTGRRILDGVDLDLRPGVNVLLGRSGSGKTTLARVLVGRPGRGLAVTEETRPAMRFGYVPQEPARVLNPALRIGRVLDDIAAAAAKRGGRVSVPEALSRAAFPTHRDMLRRFPHQLSGGQQQRLVLAHALLTDPDCLVLDEPTTGQDPGNRAALLAEIAGLAAAGLPILMVTHDLTAARAVADHVAVLDAGRIVESGAAEDVLTHPSAAATRALIGAEDRRAERVVAGHRRRLEVTGVTVTRRGTALLPPTSLVVADGECVAVVGPSGSGKTTLARCIAGVERADSGEIRLDGRLLAADLRRRSAAQVAAIGFVYQDAKASLDPFRTVWDQTVSGVRRLRDVTDEVARERTRAALDTVSLPVDVARRLPTNLSGGEAQRAALARVLAPGPELLICDEVTTGLDPVACARVLETISEAARSQSVAVIIITHNPDIVRSVADRIVAIGGSPHDPAFDEGSSAALA